MEARAKAQFVRIAPRKVGVVLDLIRGKDLETALAIVRHTPKAASEPIGKLLKSAAANAENNFSMNKDALYVAEAHVGAGPILKRVMPRAQGRAFRINKRTSHITVVLKEKE
ncbi:MAG: 50S ribosomal protein L22 [Clostridia bacterium]|nr:50S ribosomal protein L22 [Clostridia bacterium]MBQ3076951.1 50S ribosomal protein L22 [Clostridia bacterium]